MSEDLKQKLNNLRSQFAVAAQRAYDEWEQDEEGYDEILGMGGICQEIASEITDVCSDNDINCITQSAQIGDQHVWVVAYDEDTKEAYEIDINPYIYEEGSGYTWKKIPDVKFETNDFIIGPVDYPEDDLSDY